MNNNPTSSLCCLHHLVPPPGLQRRQTLEDELLAINDHLELDGSTLLDDERVIFEHDSQSISTHVGLSTHLDLRFAIAKAADERTTEVESDIDIDIDGDGDSDEETEEFLETSTTPPTFLSLNIAGLSSWHTTHQRLSTVLPPTNPDTHIALSRHAETLYTWLNVSALPYIAALERYARESTQTNDALLDKVDEIQRGVERTVNLSVNLNVKDKDRDIGNGNGRGYGYGNESGLGENQTEEDEEVEVEDVEDEDEEKKRVIDVLCGMVEDLLAKSRPSWPS